MPAPSGFVLPPRYEPIAPLGKGGGGEVWAVRDRITSTTVALKALGEHATEAEMLALVREAVALSGVEGLGVPRVLRFGRLSESGRSYLVRELVEGESLADRIEKGEDTLGAIRAIAQAADQLTRLHRALLLHGDLKPANIIVGSDGRATLVDLGLAATWQGAGAKLQGMTPRYAAPELFQGAPLTVRAEVFALGATLREVLEGTHRLGAEIEEALSEVIARATADDPAARYPSADELANALRRAAHIAEPSTTAPPSTPRALPSGSTAAESSLVWPVIGLDGPSAQLRAHIAALRAGGGIVVTGPRSSGRSTLLRRIAWSLGVEGHAVAWIEAGKATSASEALDIELAAHDTEGQMIVLVDDAERLGEADIERLSQVRRAGGKLVLVEGVDYVSIELPGPTFEVFALPPLDSAQGGELVRRAIPSLSDAVVAHVLMRAEGWPGRIRSILERLASAPVVAPADVDRLLGEQGGPPAESADIIHLLDKGHTEEAASALARYAGDRSPQMAILRARLAINQGDPARAHVELAGVQQEVLRGDDATLAASWYLYSARAHLRTGDYVTAERHAMDVAERLGYAAGGGASATLENATLHSGHAAEADAGRQAPRSGESTALGSIVAEAMAVAGLAQSFEARHEDARATLERAVQLAQSLRDPRVQSLALGSLAFALQRDSHLVEAKAAYEQALAAAEEAGDAGSVATTRLNLASIAQTKGDIAAAIRHLEAAVDMGRRSGRLATLRQALLNLASLDLYLGRVARSRVSIDALADQRSDLSPQEHAQLLALEAEYAARTGDLLYAGKLCRDCAEAYAAMGRTVDAAEARLERVLFVAAGPDADAQDLLREIERAETSLQGTTAHRPLLALARGRVEALRGEDARARVAYDEALATARTSGQREWIWRALEARAALEQAGGKVLKAKRDREEAMMVLEEIAERLPRDLREVYWSDPRRDAVRTAGLHELGSGVTVMASQPGEDRLARLLEINRAIAGEHDLTRLLERVTDHAIALLRAERGFVILRSGYAKSAGKPPPDGQGSPPDVDASGEAERLSIHASRDQWGDEPHARFSQSIAEKVIRTGEPVVTASAREDTRMADYVSVHQLMLQSVACVPIRARNANVIGALYLETRLRPAVSFGEELPTLVAFADQVAIAIETARLVGENARRAQELERANQELMAAQSKLEELLGERTAQLVATRRDLRSAREVLRGHFGHEGLVGRSDAMRRVYALIDRVKDTHVPVLITGESGTGKEVVARAIHNAGRRSKGPFVGINVGAIPEHLLESELFGHVRGAFTGADRDRKGLFREATKGTILLDEIGEMPQKMQAGLLRVLQEKVVRPVGGVREEPVDTRVIAATHRDLAAMVQGGIFREDLYYRLNVIQLRVPPLRERIEDIPMLIDHFLGIFAARYNRDRRSVSRAALKRLMTYSWPGNVRQLENVLLNGWVLSDQAELDVDDFELPELSSRKARPPAVEAAELSASHTETSLDAHKAGERQAILAALATANWNRVKAAQIVGLPRRTFYRRLKEYGIQ